MGYAITPKRWFVVVVDIYTQSRDSIFMMLYVLNARRPFGTCKESVTRACPDFVYINEFVCWIYIFAFHGHWTLFDVQSDKGDGRCVSKDTLIYAYTRDFNANMQMIGFVGDELEMGKGFKVCWGQIW